MIRLILVAIFLVLFLVFGIPLLLIEWVIGKFNQRAKDISSLRIVQWAFKVILFFAGTKVVIKGEENVPKNEPVLYVGNHRSYFDIVITYSRVPDLTGYIAKKEMLRWPLLVNWMKNLHCLFLDRQDVKQGLKTILTAIDKVKAGISICIFPEGTRNRVNDTFMEFHEGSFRLATKTDCLIVPIAMNNTVSIFEKQFPKIRKTHVVLEYGKPFRPSELSKEDKKHIGEYTRAQILETLKKNEPLV